MNKGKKRVVVFSLIAAVGFVFTGAPVFADVHIVKGASPIKGDVLTNSDDITIYNEKIAVTLAIGSKNFWGMTNGSISNLALMNGEKDFGINIINDVEFLVNSWTASGGSLKATAEIVSDTPEVGIIRTKSTWLGDGKKNALDIVTTYTLAKNSSVIDMKTEVSNPGPDTYKDMRSGYSLSALSAFMFGPFGYNTPDVRAKHIKVGLSVDDPMGDFVVSYRKDYAVTLQMDNTETYRGTTGYKDLHQFYTLESGMKKEFTGEVQVASKGHTTPFIARMITKKNLPFGNISGIVKIDDGKIYPNPVIVVEKKGSFKGTFDGSQNLGSDQIQTMVQPFVWHVGENNGSFSFNLPTGEYTVYAIAEGFTQSKKISLLIENGKKAVLDFSGENAITQGGTVNLNVVDSKTAKQIDARVQVLGTMPAVKYLGASTFFTDLEKIGTLSMKLPSGDFTFKVMSGANYTSKALSVSTTIVSKVSQTLEAQIVTLAKPEDEKWYSVDLHHHSNIGDGNTSPLDLLRSQKASRLDLAFVSDHDSVGSHAEVNRLSKVRKTPFIPSLEVSPGWGHMNILPMPLQGKPIDPTMNVADIISAAHKQKSLVIINHPYSDYGYFNNRGIVPGGFTPDFDLIELQPTIDLSQKTNIDTKTLTETMRLWSESLAGKNKAYYLTGGSDTHEVTSPTLYSGIIRTYAKVKKSLSPATFIEAVSKGNSYVTMGPLLFPADVCFGDTVTVSTGTNFRLKIDAFAANGLSTLEFYSMGSEIGKPLEVKNLNGSSARETIEFTMPITESTWVNVIAKDKEGKVAISNPIWIVLKK